MLKSNSHRILLAKVITSIIIGFLTACANNPPNITIQSPSPTLISTPDTKPTISPRLTLTTTPQPTATHTAVPSRSPTKQPDEFIRVMTLNILVGGTGENNIDIQRFYEFMRRSDPSAILQGISFDGYTNRIPRIIELVEQIDPDILGIQEAVGWEFNDDAIARAFAHELDMNYYFDINDDQVGNIALFTKLEIVSGEVFTGICDAFPNLLCGNQIHVELVTDQGNTLHVFVIHTGHNEIEIPKLIEISEPYFAKNTILMGDYNGGFDYLLDLGFRDAELKRIASDPQWGIDHIWVSPPLTSYTRQIYEGISYASEDILSMSDHQPVLAEIGLYPP